MPTPVPYIHSTAIVEENVTLHDGVRIWHFAHIRNNAELGINVSIGKSVFVDSGVSIGDESRIQNAVNIYQGVSIGSYCFIGPGVTFTNDRRPRIGLKQWTLEKTQVQDGASIGAGVIVRCGITIHSFAMIGAASFITKDVPAFTLVTGTPATPIKYICACGSTTAAFNSKTKSTFNFINNCCTANLLPGALSCADSVLTGL